MNKPGIIAYKPIIRPQNAKKADGAHQPFYSSYEEQITLRLAASFLTLTEV